MGCQGQFGDFEVGFEALDSGGDLRSGGFGGPERHHLPELLHEGLQPQPREPAQPLVAGSRDLLRAEEGPKVIEKEPTVDGQRFRNAATFRTFSGRWASWPLQAYQALRGVGMAMFELGMLSTV